MPKLIPQQMGKILYLLTRDCQKKDLDKAIAVFLNLVVTQQMKAKIPYIVHAFMQYAQKAEGVIPASVTTTFPLSEKQKKELAKTFSFDEGMSKEVVDPSILGGVIVAFEGKRIDASFRSALNRMAHQL
ncbi:MAG: hypothetical protein HOL80_02725 [Candidatus Magasanikbacteria bacterium]|jgi:F0F1-type ATP synthase delta subunit|nr:hypothetical protein [Candidatus Magasanikbacteria bacterium]MBT5262790.1 hypothetical protein [Candidatus Magasanikbacteria bacterium]MBT5820050.1 hypothetical protein [Candidatus Magasanikbacteria bacterium]MBT6294372.1 hypothetical protein [Candidatus Magasanikbacteria bacterium]